MRANHRQTSLGALPLARLETIMNESLQSRGYPKSVYRRGLLVRSLFTCEKTLWKSCANTLVKKRVKKLVKNRVEKRVKKLMKNRVANQ